MNGDRVTSVVLTLKQLFIADHGIRERLKRPGITQQDKAEEEAALDEINNGIRQALRGEMNECHYPRSTNL